MTDTYYLFSIEDPHVKDPQSDHYFQPDSRLIPTPAAAHCSVPTRSSEEPASVVVSNVLTRELCAKGLIGLRVEVGTESVDDGLPEERLYLFDLRDSAHPQPFIVLCADGGVWGSTLALTLRGSERRSIKGESWNAREVMHLIRRAESASIQIPEEGPRSSALALLQSFKTVHATSRTWTTGEWREWPGMWDELEDQLHELLDEDFDDPQGAMGLLEDLQNHRHLVPDDETSVFEIAVGPWADGMSWEALSIEQQVVIATDLAEEDLIWVSLFATALLLRHPGTTAEAKAVISLSRLMSEITAYERTI